MREDYWGSLDPLSPWRRKCLKFLTAGQVFTHKGVRVSVWRALKTHE